MNFEEAKKQIKSKRKSAHTRMDHNSDDDDTREAGEFSAYTDAINILNRVDEIKVKLE